MDTKTLMTLYLTIGIPVIAILIILPAYRKKKNDKSDKNDK
jgi:hypothetical protein